MNAIENNSVNNSRDLYRLKTFQSSLNLLTHVLIGFVAGGSLLFAFKSGVPIRATPLHIVLCVIGYQLLMAEAILSLSPHNTWSAHLRFVDKKRAHWMLQVAGSALAIAGSIIKILDKNVHFNTYHGQFGLVALIFTSLSMVNGLTSLYAYEIRRCIPAKLSKLTHICFGAIAYGTSNIALCYGFEKGSFVAYAGNGMTYTLIAFTSVVTFIIIISPFITFITKIPNPCRNSNIGYVRIPESVSDDSIAQ